MIYRLVWLRAMCLGVPRLAAALVSVETFRDEKPLSPGKLPASLSFDDRITPAKP
jgi:hypothetical protein